MELILAPESAPFTTAIMFVMLLGATEAISLLIGISISGFFDHLTAPHFDAHADSGLGWLHLGKVPLLVLLMLFLTAFALTGFACNTLFHTIFGGYPTPVLSSAVAFLTALLAMRICAPILARIIPSDETSAVSLDTLVGHIAIIVNGTAKKNYPAQARVTTEKGQTFYIRVEPDSETEQFVQNDSVLLIKQISGTRFLACANPHPDLL
ncbi:hypothetical protein BCS42_03110 [Crenothrix sp. D3]|nr:hypothetical protein BCS42_03110 [Crenothrix sp. D3]